MCRISINETKRNETGPGEKNFSSDFAQEAIIKKRKKNQQQWGQSLNEILCSDNFTPSYLFFFVANISWICRSLEI